MKFLPGAFGARKRTNIDISSDLYVELRIMAFRRGVSIQEIFEEFTAHLVAGHAGANSIVDGLVARKQKQAIEQLGGKPFPAKRMPKVEDSKPDGNSEDSIYDILAQNDPWKRDE